MTIRLDETSFVPDPERRTEAIQRAAIEQRPPEPRLYWDF